MKKFYLLLMASVCYVTTVLAQPYNNPVPPCPAAMAVKYYLMPGTPSYYKIFIGNGPIVTPAALVSMIQPAALGGQPVPDANGTTLFTPLDNTGGVTIVYPSTYTVHHIDVDFNLAGTHYTCKYLADAGGSLPIKLSSFNGRLSTETEATISWTSALEENSFKYEVQRSADGKNFVTVGAITAAGTSLETKKYSFNDPLPGTGAYFYRLRMIDIDGSAELSKTVYVNSKKGAGVVTKVFPNPFTSEIQLIGATSSDLTPNNVKVFSVTGQRINYRIVGANAIAIDENSPRGMYLVQIKEQIFKVNKL